MKPTLRVRFIDLYQEGDYVRKINGNSCTPRARDIVLNTLLASNINVTLGMQLYLMTEQMNDLLRLLLLYHILKVIEVEISERQTAKRWVLS